MTALPAGFWVPESVLDLLDEGARDEVGLLSEVALLFGAASVGEPLDTPRVASLMRTAFQVRLTLTQALGRAGLASPDAMLPQMVEEMSRFGEALESSGPAVEALRRLIQEFGPLDLRLVGLGGPHVLAPGAEGEAHLGAVLAVDVVLVLLMVAATRPTESVPESWIVEVLAIAEDALRRIRSNLRYVLAGAPHVVLEGSIGRAVAADRDAASLISRPPPLRPRRGRGSPTYAAASSSAL